jgi:hypothetical protein
LGLTKAQARLRPTWLAVSKAATVPWYTTTQWTHGIFTDADVADSVANRVLDAVEARAPGPSDSATVERQEEESKVFFPLPTTDWFSQGVALAALDPGAARFLSQAHGLGAVERKYHVLCRVPRCLSTLGAAEDQVRVESTRSRVTNPSIRARFVKRRLLAAQEEGTPGCVYRDGLMRGGLCTGALLSEAGRLQATFAPPSTLGESDGLARAISGLFAGASQAGKPRSVDDACGPSCPCHAQSELRDVSALHQRFADSVQVPKRFNPAHAVSLKYRLLGFNRSAGVALYDVSTLNATEAQIRAAFAFSGLPVVNDPQYDIEFSTHIAQSALSQSVRPADAFSVGRRRAASETDRVLMSVLSDSTFSGIGLACHEVVFPDPMSDKNRGALLTLSAAKLTWGAQRTAAAYLNDAEVEARAEATCGAFDRIRVCSAPSESLFKLALSEVLPIAVDGGADEIGGALEACGSAAGTVQPSTTAVMLHESNALEQDGIWGQLQLHSAPLALSRAIATVLRPHSAMATIAATPKTTTTDAKAPPRHHPTEEQGAAPRTRCMYCFGFHWTNQCPHLGQMGTDAPGAARGDRVSATRLGRDAAPSATSGAHCLRCGSSEHRIDRCPASIYARVVGDRCLVCDEAFPDHPAVKCPKAHTKPLAPVATEHRPPSRRDKVSVEGSRRVDQRAVATVNPGPDRRGKQQQREGSGGQRGRGQRRGELFRSVDDSSSGSDPW